MRSIRDVLGRELRVGQQVAVAAVAANVGFLRVGLVEGVHEDTNKVSIRWTDGRPFGAKVSTIAVRGERVDRPRIAVIG